MDHSLGSELEVVSLWWASEGAVFGRTAQLAELIESELGASGVQTPRVPFRTHAVYG